MRLRDQLRFDRHILFHAQTQHEVLHAFAAENAQQIVLQMKGRSANCRGRPDVRRGREAGCRCGANRGVRCRRYAVRPARPLRRARARTSALTSASVRSQSALNSSRSGSLPCLLKNVARHRFRVAAQQNIGTAAGHVGRNGDPAFAARLRHNVGFALVILGVQNLVLDAHLFEHGRQVLGFLDRDGAHQHRLSAFVEFLDLFRGVAELLFFGPVDDVLILLADHRPVRRNHSDIELVDLLEFRRFRFRGTGHAGELVVQAGSSSGS